MIHTLSFKWNGSSIKDIGKTGIPMQEKDNLWLFYLLKKNIEFAEVP